MTTRKLPATAFNWQIRLLSAALILGANAPGLHAGQPEGDSPELHMLADASLHDVHFPTPQHGYAVGDRGAIWATFDGGLHWHRQETPARCTLQSVHFVDANTGWAVGGWIHPYTHRTTGVVLRTRDGGQRWLATPGLSLPDLHKVKFFDEHRGWAIGASSPLYPSGLFRTEDAGRTWRTVPTGRTQSLLTGDFLDDLAGAVAGRAGELQIVRGGKVKDSRTADLGNRSLRCLKLDGPEGWLAGDDGLLMHTADGGLSWRLAAPPALQAAQFDFHGVAMRDGEVWVVGSPGSIVFHSKDRGQTWRALRTGQALPLRAVHFVNPRQGWAVGDFGTILGTSDGGQTWSHQHEGGRRAAMLGLISQPDAIPWEVLSRYAGDQGYLSVIQTIGHRNAERQDTSRAELEPRLRAGILACGGSGATVSNSFPLRQKGVELSEAQLLQLWKDVNDGDPLQQLEALLAKRIRQWRPEVVVIDEGSDPLSKLTARVAVAAVRAAGSPTAHSLQLTTAGLEPWSAKKVFLNRSADKPQTTADQVQVLPSQLAAQLGASVGEVASRGRSMQATAPERNCVQLLRLIDSKVPQQLASRDLFQGLSLRPGGEARRETANATVPLDLLTRRAQLTRNTEAFVDQTLKNGLSDRWAAGLSELTTELPASGAGALLYQIAESFRRRGRLDLATDVLERLVQEHPDHEVAESAMLMLIRYYTSTEDAWRRQSMTIYRSQTSVAEKEMRQARESDVPNLFGGAKQRPRVGPATSFVANATSAAGHHSPAQRHKRAMELAERVRQSHPSLFLDPEFRFVFSAAERFSGTRTDGFHQSLISGSHAQNPWAQRAMAELWLAGGMQGQPPIPTTHCPRGPKPFLDGELDDAIWAMATPLELRTGHYDDSQWPAAALVGWDLDYLFIAASCEAPTSPSAKPTSTIDSPINSAGLAPVVPAMSGPRLLTASHATTPNPLSEPERQRDADMTEFDRIGIRLDRDRDYVTSYEFWVDQRGWGSERCLDDATWNPNWHIATRQRGNRWTLEAAIPWKALAASAPQRGETWALNLTRVLPGHGVQSWTQRGTVESNVEGFGILVFQAQ
ncbi:MAG: tetratricopeptide repeat protein [Planctomycetales bacterium]|nr:tetratricopeptide repeat protein [Planctomycetales bacterium]